MTPPHVAASPAETRMSPHARITSHEEVCAVRYDGINSRLKRLETIMIGSAGATILFLATIVAKIH